MILDRRFEESFWSIAGLDSGVIDPTSRSDW
jgi:hypothetical protein